MFICDRIKDTIIVAGENVYPAEVEYALGAHPGVDDAGVGAPDGRWGEAVRAYVVTRSDQRFVADVDAVPGTADGGVQAPDHLRVRRHVPRNPSGKILRRLLRERQAGSPKITSADAAP